LARRRAEVRIEGLIVSAITKPDVGWIVVFVVVVIFVNWAPQAVCDSLSSVKQENYWLDHPILNDPEISARLECWCSEKRLSLDQDSEAGKAWTGSWATVSAS